MQNTISLADFLQIISIDVSVIFILPPTHLKLFKSLSVSWKNLLFRLKITQNNLRVSLALSSTLQIERQRFRTSLAKDMFSIAFVVLSPTEFKVEEA